VWRERGRDRVGSGEVGQSGECRGGRDRVGTVEEGGKVWRVERR
jgi:hypothetical protein